jgi:hypothetical protein
MWHPTRHNLKVAYLVGLIVVLAAINLIWTARTVNSVSDRSRQATQIAIDENNRQWCDSLELITSGPGPSSKQPGLTKLYDDFKRLEQHFGCVKP